MLWIAHIYMLGIRSLFSLFYFDGTLTSIVQILSEGKEVLI